MKRSLIFLLLFAIVAVISVAYKELFQFMAVVALGWVIGNLAKFLDNEVSR